MTSRVSSKSSSGDLAGLPFSSVVVVVDDTERLDILVGGANANMGGNTRNNAKIV